MASSLDDQQLVLGRIGPPVRVCRTKNQLENGKRLDPGEDILDFQLTTLRGDQNFAIKIGLRLLVLGPDVYRQQVRQLHELAINNLFNQLSRDWGMTRANGKGPLRLVLRG